MTLSYVSLVLSALLVSPAHANEEEVGATPEEAEAAALPDRSERPLVKPPELLALPELSTHALQPGVTVRHVRVPSVRGVEIATILHRGGYDLAPDARHVAYAMGWLQDAETTSFEASALEEYEDLHELDVASGLSVFTGEISADVPRIYLDKALPLLRSVLIEPTFPKTNLKLHIRETIAAYVEDGPNDGGRLASAVLNVASYGDDSPYASKPNLTELKKIRQKDLSALHQAWLAQSPITVLVVGDLEYAEIEADLKSVFEGLGVAGEPSEKPAVPGITGQRVYAVDLAGAEQTRIALRMNAPHLGDDDRPAAALVNFALGGSFLSRLNANLREDKGFTYGIGSSYLSWQNRAWWNVSVEVAAENTAAAVTEITFELDKVASDGLTAEELAASRNSIVTTWNETLETAASAMSFYRSLIYDDLTVSGEREIRQAYSSVTADDTKRVSAKYLGPETGRVWAIVGDRAKIESQLTEELGWTPVWVSPEDAIMGDF